MKLKNLALTALILLFIFLVGLNLSLWSGYTYITVTGTSTEEQENRVAYFTANVSSTNEEKTVVNSEITSKSEQVMEAIKDFGIPEEKIETTNVNLFQMDQPRTVEGETTFEPGDWRGNVSIEIKLENTDRASELTSLLTSLDISDIYGPRFSLDQSSKDESELLESAYDNAKGKAQEMANKLGKRLGSAIEIVETGSNLKRKPGIQEALGLGGGAEIPFEPGTTQISKTVTVKFRLK